MSSSSVTIRIFNLTRKIDPAPASGQNVPVTLYKYDSKNNLIETIPPKGVNSGTSVTCSTNLSAAINTTYATDMTYDANGVDLLSSTRQYTDPNLGLQTATTKFEYNDSANPGMVTRIIPPLGNTGPTPDYSYATSYAYYNATANSTEAGMLQSTTDPLGNVTSYTYDAVGRKLTMVDPNGNVSGGTPSDHTWSYTYDNEDRLTSVSAPAPTSGGTALTTNYTYDPVGNRTVVTDANGQVTKYSYDVREMLSEVDESPLTWTNPASPPATVYKTTYTYDNLGNLSQITRDAGDSANERATAYTYDGLNRLRSETQYPAWPTTTPTLVTSYTYDANSNRVTLTDPLGKATTYVYDALNRLTSISYKLHNTHGVTYAYDADNNRTSMVDGTGTTTYTYDEFDRPTAITSPGSQTAGYRYDLNGNRTKLIYPDSTAVVYTFDKANQLASFQDWASHLTSYQYDPDGSLKLATNPDGTTATNTFDNAERLTRVLNANGATTISQHAYTLDNVGNRTQVQETLAQVGGGTTNNTIAYSYDQLYRLTGDGTRSYSYDPVGNRLSLVQGTTTNYSYDKADRIQSAGTTSYSTNADGDVTARGSDSFTYDQENRLISATIGGASSSYTYDGDGKRASKTVGSTTTNYVYDASTSLPVVLTDGTLKYVYGAGLAYTVDSSGNVQVAHTDGLGSVRALTDGTGSVVQTYETDPFGVSTQTQGTSTQPFQFTGQQQDAESSFYYLRARYYDPTIGRFLTRDPQSGSAIAPQTLNLYAYADNNPVTLTDPSGRFGCRDFLCAAVGAGAAAISWLTSPEGFTAVATAIGVAKTFQDPSQSLKEKVVTVGILLAGTINPGDILKSGRLVSGDFPRTANPGEVLYR